MIESLPHSPHCRQGTLYHRMTITSCICSKSGIFFTLVGSLASYAAHSSCFVYIMALLAQNNCVSVSGFNRAVCFHEDDFGMYGNSAFRLENQRAAL